MATIENSPAFNGGEQLPWPTLVAAPSRLERAGARLKRRDDAICHPVANELVVWDARRETAVSLNLSAAAVWDLCDGTLSREEITAELAQLVGCDPEILRADVEKTVQELISLDLIEELPGGEEEQREE